MSKTVEGGKGARLFGKGLKGINPYAPMGRCGDVEEPVSI
jgi:hypothetical protein